MVGCVAAARWQNSQPPASLFSSVPVRRISLIAFDCFGRCICKIPRQNRQDITVMEKSTPTYIIHQ
jgi:hypothetical protein